MYALNPHMHVLPIFVPVLTILIYNPYSIFFLDKAKSTLHNHKVAYFYGISYDRLHFFSFYKTEISVKAHDSFVFLHCAHPVYVSEIQQLELERTIEHLQILFGSEK